MLLGMLLHHMLERAQASGTGANAQAGND